MCIYMYSIYIHIYVFITIVYLHICEMSNKLFTHGWRQYNVPPSSISGPLNFQLALSGMLFSLVTADSLAYLLYPYPCYLYSLSQVLTA